MLCKGARSRSGVAWRWPVSRVVCVGLMGDVRLVSGRLVVACAGRGGGMVIRFGLSPGDGAGFGASTASRGPEDAFGGGIGGCGSEARRSGAASGAWAE